MLDLVLRGGFAHPAVNEPSFLSGRILEAHGYRVIRVTWEQAVMRPAATLRRIAEAGAPRAVD